MDYSGCRPLKCQNPASLSALTNNLKIVILTWDDFHLQGVTETVPYFMLAGRQNYTRYTPVYIAEMKELEQTQPLMFEHLMQGGFVVRRSENRAFNSVPTSINREAKSCGGVIDFTLRKGALLRWLMTRHVTGEYAQAFEELWKSTTREKLHDAKHFTDVEGQN